MNDTVASLEQYQTLRQQDAAAFYFYGDNCQTCLALRPKIIDLLKNSFPKIRLYLVDAEKNTEIAAQNSIMNIPALLVYFDGQETIRQGRYLSIQALEQEIDRPYQLFFS